MGRRFTQSALEKELVKKEENFKKAGNEAELFVLRFEQEKYKHLDASITKGIERIRFATSHPRYFTNRLIEACSTLPKICLFAEGFLITNDPSVDNQERFQVYMGHFPAGASV